MQTLPSHFDGKRFRNLEPRRNRYGALVRWLLSRRPAPWRQWSDAQPGAPPPRRSERLRITFINHATFLLQLDGINVLTDPIWSERASPVSWAGPRRRRPPGIRLPDLPPIDLVLLSHDHYDHRDMWITAVPAQHFSGRSPFQTDKTLWCGFVVQTNASSVYFAGDTGAGPHIGQIARRFPGIDLAILPIGAFRPEWFMGEVHMSPREAVEAHLALRAHVSVASHFGTFALADDGQDEAVQVLRDVLSHAKLHDTEFWVLGFGEGRELPPRAASLDESRQIAL
jgi:L-ascorbate metabolism protein UlaG (beta-lactamase superfamily)